MDLSLNVGSAAIPGQIVSGLSWQRESKGDSQVRSTQGRSGVSLHRKEEKFSIKARLMSALMRILHGKPRAGQDSSV